MFKWITLLFLCVIFTSLAQDRYDEVRNMSLEELMQVPIKVSTSTPSEMFEKPSVVSVIDKDLIKNYHFESVADAIRIVAGVDITQTTLDRNVEAFRGILQSFYNNKVLMLINNIPTWNTLYGSHTLDRIDINDVERIEILKGPASVLYGSNAYSGVINVITKTDKEDKLRGNLRLGYPSLMSASVEYTANLGDFKLCFSGSNKNEYRKPYLMNFAPDPVLDQQGNTVAFDSIAYFQEKYNSSSTNINLIYKKHSLFTNIFQHEYTYPGMNISYASSANSRIRDRGILTGYSAQELTITDDISLNAQLYLDYFERDHVDNYEKTTEITLGDSKFGAIANIDYLVNKYLSLEVGADIVSCLDHNHQTIYIPTDSIIAETLNNAKHFNEYSVFTQVDLSYGLFSMLFGSRVTENETFGSNISSRATANFKLANTQAVKILYAEAYRVPNMLELYGKHITVVGNPDLSPETSKSYELSYLSKFHNLMAQATVYYTDYNNIILRERPDLTQAANYKNVARFSGYGAEIEMRYINKKFINGYLNYNYLAGDKSIDANNNYQFIPKHTVSLGLDKSFGNLSISGNTYIYTKTRGLLEDIPAQYTINTHVSYHHNLKNGIGLTHSVSVTNINDSDMLIPEYIRKRETVNALPTSAFGRRIFYSLTLSL